MSRDASLRVRPRYVERGGDIVFRHPFVTEGARMYNFLLEADPVRLEALLHRTLNEPSGGAVDYRPMSAYVVLNFVSVDRLASARPDDRLGSIREREVAIWVPCFDHHAGRRVLWSVPYMYVDSGTAMASGREVFGYPKQLGSITMPDDGGVPQVLNLKTLGCRQFSPGATGRELDVVTVRRVAGAPRPLASFDQAELALSALDDLVNSADAMADRDRLAQAAASALRDPADFALTAFIQILEILHSRLHMVFLKQFRSAEVSEEACYQAVVEVPHPLKRFRSFGFLPGNYEVCFEILDSQPIVQELGMRSAVQQPRLAYRLEFDFMVDPGRVVWQAI